jgi:hypothetical protein
VPGQAESECSTLRRSRGALLLVAGVVRGRRARKLRLRGDRAAIPPMRVLRGLLLRRQLRLRLRTRGCTGADCCIARRGESARRPRRRTALEGRRQVSAALEQSTAVTNFEACGGRAASRWRPAEAAVMCSASVRRRSGSQRWAPQSSASTRSLAGDLLAPGRTRARFPRAAGLVQSPTRCSSSARSRSLKTG